MRRPNLPTSPRAYPRAFQLRLVPFGMEAVEQFVFLERPASLESDGDNSAPGQLPELGNISDIFSSERQYETLGQLYRGIEDGLKYLTQKYGEQRLFIGRVAAQSDTRYFGFPGLVTVRDLASALEAVNVIIEQGEGASFDAEDSHYKRFLTMRDEYQNFLVTDPSFAPGRPVLTSPYATLPSDLANGLEVQVVDDALSGDVCNLFDGGYELMVQMLGRLFVHAEESEDDLRVLADTAIGLMIDVVAPLGCATTLLPAGPSHPGFNAGPSFRLSRGASIPTHGEAARFVFHERLSELSAYCRFLQAQKGAPAALSSVAEALTGFAAQFAAPARA
jgi:Ferritin-like